MAKVSLTALWNDFQAWIARRDNPHAVTAGQANAYTRAEIDSLLDGYMPAGTLPFSSFGFPDSDTINFSSARVSGIQWRVVFGEFIPVVMGGRPYQLQQLSWTFPVANNTTVYLYLIRDPSLGYNSVQVEAVTTPRADKTNNFFIGTAASDGTNLTVVIKPVIMISVYRISADPVGGAIPVSTGLPTETGTYKW